MKVAVTRKTILLGLIAVFAVLYGAQLFFDGQGSARILKLKSAPDSITIVSSGSVTAELWKNGDVWSYTLTGNRADAKPADSGAIETLLDELGELTVLGTVSSGHDPERFGLESVDTLQVTVRSQDKTLLTLSVGKRSVTGTQTYVTVDGKKEVLLISGNLKDTLTLSAEKLDIKPEQTVGTAPAEISTEKK